MLLIGLTGGIASGKSTVSRMFRELGVPILDADILSREVVEPGKPAWQEISKAFPDVIDAQGNIDRQALGTRIFQNEQDRKTLNAIVHPHVQNLFRQRMKELSDSGASLAMYDVPLLIENNLQKQMNGVILVYVPFDIQLKRLMLRNSLSRDEAMARLHSQMPLDQKRTFATWIIDNSGTIEETRSQVHKLWPLLSQSQPHRPNS